MIKIINKQSWTAPATKQNITPEIDLLEDKITDVYKNAYYNADDEIDVISKLKLAELNGLLACAMLKAGYLPEEIEEYSTGW